MVEDIFQRVVDLSVVGQPPIAEGLNDAVKPQLGTKVGSKHGQGYGGVGHTLRSMSAAWASLFVGSMTAPGAGFSDVCLGAAGNDIIRGWVKLWKGGWVGEKRSRSIP